MTRSQRLLTASGGALLLAALVAVAGTGATAPSPAAGSDGAGDRPNVITIVTDDQDDLLFTPELMPKTFGLFDEGATRLTNFTIVTPLCCPSRAAQLTGQYGHNNGVLANDPGYPALREPDNVLPAWLQNAGYETARVGRFLNGYREAGRAAQASPGWDHWVGLMALHYRDYKLSTDGVTETYRGNGKRSYVTRTLGHNARRLVREMAAGDKPFYLQIDELAPHSDHLAEGSCAKSALPGPGLLAPVRDLRLPARPAKERDVSDKPSYIRSLPRVDAQARAAVQQRMRCRAASLREIDRSVGKLTALLDELGIAENTILIYYSDNGFFSGQHRLLKSKGLPYEESIQVPALIDVPPAVLGAEPEASTDLPLANIDLVPTILDLADAEPCLPDGRCRRLDGRSMLPALRDPRSWDPERPLLIEVDQRNGLAGGTLACTWSGVRVGSEVYVEYERVAPVGSRKCRPTDEAEHYRLDRDPHQRHNLWPPADEDDAADQARLEATLERLRDCSGASCS